MVSSTVSLNSSIQVKAINSLTSSLTSSRINKRCTNNRALVVTIRT